jgi:hypothetical protein
MVNTTTSRHNCRSVLARSRQSGHSVRVRARLRGTFIIVALGLSACGGTSSSASSPAPSTSSASTTSPPPKVFDESKVEAALMKAKTSRYEGVSGPSKTRLSGVLSYPRQYASWHSDSGRIPDIAFLHSGSRFYLRQPTGQWCLQSDTTKAHGSAPSGMIPVLGSLVPWPPKGSHARYVGSEQVRGVAASHFHFGGAVPVDLWVDGHNLLRRFSEGSAMVHFTDEYFDYGVSVTFTEPTANTPECQHG